MHAAQAPAQGMTEPMAHNRRITIKAGRDHMHALVVVDVHALRRSLRLAARGNPEQRRMHRMHCVLLVGLGRSCQEVARWFGDSPRSIERWVGAFNRRGIPGLDPAARRGRSARLTPGDLLRLDSDLQRLPNDWGYAESRWSGRLLLRHLGLQYGVTMGLRQCQRTLSRLAGTGPARPDPHATAF
jgi:transposase